jgi:hypothetical protein
MLPIPRQPLFFRFDVVAFKQWDTTSASADAGGFEFFWKFSFKRLAFPRFQHFYKNYILDYSTGIIGNFMEYGKWKWNDQNIGTYI